MIQKHPSFTGYLIGLIGIEVMMAIAYATSVLLHGDAYPAFDFDGRGSIPSFMQAIQLFLLGAIPLTLLILQGNTSNPPSPGLLGVAAIFFLYAACDEVLKFHLQLGHHAWRFVYLSLGFAMPLVFHRDMRRLWHFHRQAIYWIVLGIGIFILGGFGTEILKAYLLKPILHQLYPDHSTIPLLVETIRVTAEEFSELLGESLTLYGVCLLAVKRIQGGEGGRSS